MLSSLAARTRDKVATVGASPIVSAVIKATSTDISSPKEKHVRICIVTLAKAQFHGGGRDEEVKEWSRAMGSRMAGPGSTPTAPWIVPFKALALLHRLLREDVAPLVAEEARRNSKSFFRFDGYEDKTSENCWVYTRFVKRYARFLEELVFSFNADLWDRRFRRGMQADTSPMVNYPIDQLLEAMKKCQRQFDALLDLGLDDMTNRKYRNHATRVVVSYALSDALLLVKVVNDGTMNLLDKYFSLEMTEACVGMAIYERLVAQLSACNTMFTTLQTHAEYQDVLPDVRPPPASIVPSMKEYINDLKTGTANHLDAAQHSQEIAAAHASASKQARELMTAAPLVELEFPGTFDDDSIVHGAKAPHILSPDIFSSEASSPVAAGAFHDPYSPLASPTVAAAAAGPSKSATAQPWGGNAGDDPFAAAFAAAPPPPANGGVPPTNHFDPFGEAFTPQPHLQQSGLPRAMPVDLLDMTPTMLGGNGVGMFSAPAGGGGGGGGGGQGVGAGTPATKKNSSPFDSLANDMFHSFNQK